MCSRSSFPETHSLFAGFLQAAPEGVAKMLRGADLIVVVGAPVFTFHVEGICDLFTAGTPVFQLTDDPTEAASAGVGESIMGTLPKSLAALLSALPKSTNRHPPAARPTAPAARAATPIPPNFVLSTLSRLLPSNAIVVEEAPSHRPAIQAYLPRPGADSFYTMASGSLGYSLPAAIGVALARPGRRIVCLVGDGSSMYSIQAIWTAAQRKLPITFIVMNNSGYGAMRSFSRVMQAERAPGLELPGLDFVALATGFGCAAERVTRPETLNDALASALVAPSPILVDIVVDDAVAVLYDEKP